MPVYRAPTDINFFGATPQYRSYLGDIPIYNFMNAQFYAKVSAGTPAQQFTAIYDTGSSNLWLPSTTCASCGLHPRYNHDKSTSYVKDGRDFHIEYGSGPVSGYFSQDNVEMGGIVVDNMPFAEIEDVTGLGMAYMMGKFDGILGLGFRSISVEGIPSPFELAFEQGKIKENLFAFRLPKTTEELGSIYVGEYPDNVYAGNLTWVPLNSKTYWQTELNGLRLGSDTIKTECIRAILDTGTSLLAGPTADVRFIAKAVGATPLNERQYLIDCNKELPPLTFTLAGRSFTLDDYRINAGQGVCILGMMPIDVPSGAIWILGDVFLAKYFSVYDYTNARVGIAPAL